ncbi:MAG: hypothetical protein ACLFR1_13910 [Spirochaetia bacterium]
MNRTYTAFFLVFLMLYISCVSEPHVPGRSDAEPQTNTGAEGLDSTEYLSEASDLPLGVQAVILGKIALGRNNRVCIITNWLSRSRVSHYVIGEYAQLLESNIDSYARVRGIISNSENNPFLKTIEITEVIEITEDPPEQGRLRGR